MLVAEEEDEETIHSTSVPEEETPGNEHFRGARSTFLSLLP